MPEYYTLTSTVTPDQCDNNGIMRPDAWFSLYQEAAGDHNRLIRCDHNGHLPARIVWIMLGVHAEWQAPSRAGDTLCISTAPAAHSHGMYQRRTIAADPAGRAIASSVSYWTLMDRDTRRITRDETIQRIHAAVEIGPGQRPSSYQRLDGIPCKPWSYACRDLDIDANGHVNNARYIAWLCDALNHPRYIRSLDVSYASEVLPRESVTGQLASDADGRFTFEVYREGQDRPCFTAQGQV